MKKLIIDKENPMGTVVEVADEPYPQLTYEQLVEQFIRERYSLNAELAILRQRDTKIVEFVEYNAYAEECKERAKQIVKGV